MPQSCPGKYPQAAPYETAREADAIHPTSQKEPN
jgi:hypothetical protein